jgi:hypothetical protein
MSDALGRVAAHLGARRPRGRRRGTSPAKEEAPMRPTIGALALLLAGAAAGAQLPTAEIRPFGAAYVATGPLRDGIHDGFLMGVQGALDFSHRFHLTGAWAWMPGRTRLATDQRYVDVLQYDLGVEWGTVRHQESVWEIHPFVGAGAGARNFEYRAEELVSSMCAVGYGAGGVELQMRRLGVRFEARDNVFCYKSPYAGGRSATRSDVWLSLGLALHLPK